MLPFLFCNPRSKIQDRMVLAHLAGGEEGVSYDLTRLASGGVSTWPEVGQVVRSAWLAYSTARVAVHYSKVVSLQM